MPAVSRRQQRYLFWKFGAPWVKAHHFNNSVIPPKHKRHGYPKGHPLARLYR